MSLPNPIPHTMLYSEPFNFSKPEKVIVDVIRKLYGPVKKSSSLGSFNVNRKFFPVIISTIYFWKLNLNENFEVIFF